MSKGTRIAPVPVQGRAAELVHAALPTRVGSGIMLPWLAAIACRHSSGYLPAKKSYRLDHVNCPACILMLGKPAAVAICAELVVMTDLAGGKPPAWALGVTPRAPQ